MSGAPHPLLTLHRRLGPGPVLRRGTASDFRAVVALDGEPHVVRDELHPGTPDWSAARAARSRCLLSIAHVTDLQLADVQSPARFEFFNREFDDPRFAKLVPVQRPQESLTAHAVASMVDTLNRVPGGPVSGAPLQLVVTTGDAIDNAQWNELRTFLALFDGGLVTTASGGPAYEGVQATGWPDDVFWRPHGEGPGTTGTPSPDVFRQAHGFGHYPGLLERALTAFTSSGLRAPWLACHGNHEALIQGVGVVTPSTASAMTGGRKPVSMPDGVDRADALELFTLSPEAFLGGHDLEVSADPARRPVTRRDFVEAHFAPGASPWGHGFTERNRRDGTAYYVHDVPHVRFVALDTTCLAGAADGSVDRAQMAWLEEVLAEVHSQHLDARGEHVRTQNEDRLVVLFSHHGPDTLTNTRQLDAEGAPAATGSEVLALLHRFPNVVLWLTGHTHTNAVRPRVDPTDPSRGFWEVTTSAVVDWPCQSRLVELLEDDDGVLWIVGTMVDHDSPVSHAPGPVATWTGADLASLHRELAGNVPWAGFSAALAGTASDRNVVLPLRAPFRSSTAS